MSQIEKLLSSAATNKSLGTAAQWAQSSSIIPLNTLCYEIDTGKFKVGDGTKTYTNLAYAESTETGIGNALSFTTVSNITSPGTWVALKSADTVDVIDGSKPNVTMWVGATRSAAAANTEVMVDILGGINTHQSNLITGRIYYLDANGTLTETNTGNLVGKALSPTSIMIENTGKSALDNFTAPQRPTNTAPANGSTDAAQTPILQSSVFNGPLDTHTHSRWQIATTSDFSSVVHDSGQVNNTSLTSYTVPLSANLLENTTYYWRVMHLGLYGGWSAWSLPTSFQTGSAMGFQEWLIPGTYTFTVPQNVTAIKAYVIGAGGGGRGVGGESGGGGGAAHGIYSVTPGQQISVVVGAGGIGGINTGNWDGTSGGSTSIGVFITALGGGGATSNQPGAGGGYSGTVITAGTGGQGRDSTGIGSGGGGAASVWGGNGGPGGSGDILPTAGSYGAGGGGYSTYQNNDGIAGAGGGGTYFTLDTVNNAGGTSSNRGGAGGSGGTRGGTASGMQAGNGGNYGGGGGGSDNGRGGDGGGGAARIEWGPSIGMSGEAVFTTAGTYSWTAPAGVTSVCAVVVGGGAGGSANGASGGGGGLGWKNNIPVVPGQTYSITVGNGGSGASDINGNGMSGGSSSFASFVTATGGRADHNTTGGNGGSYTGGDGGGVGGKGGSGTPGDASSGGGGAAGYSGNGGAGANYTGGVVNPGQPGTGGGGGGGASHSTIRVSIWGGSGGGVGLYGQGANGAGGSGIGGDAGKGGSDGTAGTSGTTASGGGGLYGGGGASGDWTGRAGGHGAVRIIWGPGRSFPNNAA